MHRVLDLLSSGVHDAKNQLFLAESLLAQAEVEHGIALGEARFAIELAAQRLSRVLTAYRLQRHVAALSMSVVSVAELIEESLLVNRPHCERLDLQLQARDTLVEDWLLDRDLVFDILSNALQNASRFARTQILLSAKEEDGFLVFRVEDDGPGFAQADLDSFPHRGVGLFVAREIAVMHQRHGRGGTVVLGNGGEFGGAVFELRLP